MVDEETETFTLTLTASNLPAGVTLHDAEATGTINDDDVVPGVPTGVSAEGANEAVALRWSPPSNPGTSPIAGYEYRYKSGADDYPATWTSAGGPTATSITVPGLANDVLHTFEMRAISGAGDGVAAEVSATPVGPVVILVLDPNSIGEGGVSTVTATIAPALTVPFEIEISAAAASGDEMDVFELSANVTLRFEANETASSGTVTISAVDNAVDEDDKTVTVSGVVSAGADVPVPANQTLVIADNDVLATVSAAAESVEEGNDALFPVTLTGGTTTAAVVIGYSVASEDANPGVDYAVPSGLLTIAQGESTGTITVKTNDDGDILDPGETLEVTLTTGSTIGGGVQVSEDSATMTIADTGRANLSVGDADAVEGDAVNFEVKLTRKVASRITVSYQTANDTAESGTGKDYTAASGTLTFAANVKVMTVAVPTLEDAIDESDESFKLTVTASELPSGVTLEDGEAIGTIHDDDTRGVTMSTNALTVVKGGDSASYTLRLTSQPTGDVTINVSNPGGGVQVSPTVLTFTPQNWSSTQAVQVNATADADTSMTPSITHSVRGADYTGVRTGSVTLTIREPAGVTLGVRTRNNSGTVGTAGAAGPNLVFTEAKPSSSTWSARHRRARN